MAQDSGGTYLCILTKTEVMGWSQKNLWHDRKIKDSMEKRRNFVDFFNENSPSFFGRNAKISFKIAYLMVYY